MDNKAASSSRSPCTRFIEDSLLLPTENARLFTGIFLVIFAHTFVFTAVAVFVAHPLAASLLNDIQSLNRTSSTGSQRHSIVVDHTWEHAKKLFFIYFIYHVCRLATQLVTARATSVTYSADHCSTAGKLLVRKAIGGLIVTGALVGVLELTSTATIAVLLVLSWMCADPGLASIFTYLLCLLALLLYIWAGSLLTVSVAVSAVDEECQSICAVRRAWWLLRARRKEASVLVLIVSILPVVGFPAPVYAFSFMYLPDWFLPYNVNPNDIWLLGAFSGSSLPCVGAQLFSMVAATVFCCQSKGMKDGNANSVV